MHKSMQSSRLNGSKPSQQRTEPHIHTHTHDCASNRFAITTNVIDAPDATAATAAIVQQSFCISLYLSLFLMMQKFESTGEHPFVYAHSHQLTFKTPTLIHCVAQCIYLRVCWCLFHTCGHRSHLMTHKSSKEIYMSLVQHLSNRCFQLF